jgi:hypothetical protein
LEKDEESWQRKEKYKKKVLEDGKRELKERKKKSREKIKTKK